MFVLSLEGVYSSILYVSFHSKMQTKQLLRVNWQKNGTASLKNSKDVSAPSARFSNYTSDPEVCGIQQKECAQ